MTYKDLFDAQHEYCTTEDYSGTAIRPHAFIAGAKWLLKRFATIPLDKAIGEVVELYEEIKQEEEQAKWSIQNMSSSVPNKCENCDRFDECFVQGGRMREFCKMYNENVVFKFKK
jgi:hypothetical protein